MLNKFILLYFLLGSSILLSSNVKGQNQDNTRLQISILTCDAGDDIYTVWGHTAIRVIDSAQGTDYVFNYGTFDFDEPFFITKFVKGSLQYFLSVNHFTDFYNQYQFEKRTIKEQVLRLSKTEKARWYNALKLNGMESNRYYLYNFISDNCTTRVKDGLFKNTAFQTSASSIISYREKVVAAPYQNGIPWVGLGIDLLLGAYSDQKPNDMQAGFLPELLFDQLASVNKLVISTQEYSFADTSKKTFENQKSQIPFYTLLGILLVYSSLTLANKKWCIIVAKGLDLLLLLLFAVGGSLIFYMSLVSKHTACYQNFNLMWMHPLYFIPLIVYFINKARIGYIGKIFFASNIALLLTSYWLPQHFSMEVYLMMGMAMILNYRLIQLGQFHLKQKK